MTVRVQNLPLILFLLFIVTLSLIWPVHTVVAGPNSFNRLMTPPSARNPEPAKDGIHDPENSGTATLQHPKQAFKDLPKGKSGNYIDWVKALENKKIDPMIIQNFSHADCRS